MANLTRVLSYRRGALNKGWLLDLACGHRVYRRGQRRPQRVRCGHCSPLYGDPEPWQTAIHGGPEL